MPQEKAREFVEKFYNDEETMKQVLTLAGATEKIKAGQKVSEEQQYKDFAEAAAQMGYHATPDEYKEATKAYLEEIGSWDALGKVFHIITVASDLAKQSDQAKPTVINNL